MASLENIARALEAAHAAGDDESARVLAKYYTEMKALQPEPTVMAGIGKRMYEGIRGLGDLVGHPDVLSLGDTSGSDKALNESTAGQIGQAIGDMAVTAPTVLVPGAGTAATAGKIANWATRGVPGRIAATGAIEGLTNEKDRASHAGEGAFGALVGEGASKLIGKIAKPISSDLNPLQEQLLGTMRSHNIPVSASDSTNNRTMHNLAEILKVMPASENHMADKQMAQRLAWQKALFNKGGEHDTELATPDVMSAMRKRISDDYTAVHSNNDLVVDTRFKQRLADIRDEYLNEAIPPNRAATIHKYFNDFDSLPEGMAIPGAEYQRIRAGLAKQAGDMKKGDSYSSGILKDIRRAADEAMARSLPPEDLAKLQKANKEWTVLKSIEDAVDTHTGHISPSKLLSRMHKRDANYTVYGAGDPDLTNLAKAGKSYIHDVVDPSGTTQWHNLSRTLGYTGAAGAGIGAANYYGDDADLSKATLLGLGAAGATLFAPRAASHMIWKPNSYPAKPLADMSKEVAPGVSRQGALDFLLRNFGQEAFLANSR